MVRETSILAAGCFWGVQYYFDQVPGVLETEVGYTGGHTDNPSYEQVCANGTGHAEAVKITYDPTAVLAGDSKAGTMQGAGEKRTKSYKQYEEGASQPATQQRAASGSGVGETTSDEQAAAFRVLLKQFFRMHDPTQLNRQGPDVGDQYRSAIFYTNDGQKKMAQKIINELNKSKFDGKIITQLEPAGKWWPAEDYHQKYTSRTGLGMCHVPYQPV